MATKPRMSAGHNSYWRVQARRVITPLLPQVEAAKTRDIAKAILSKAYPFGDRQYHPYKCWLKEVKETLDRVFGRSKEPAGEVRFIIKHMPPAYPWFIDVKCTWCNGGKSDTLLRTDCLMCMGHNEAVRQLVKGGDWKTWRDAIKKEANAALVFADWLEDRGQGELAQTFRDEATRRLAGQREPAGR